MERRTFDEDAGGLGDDVSDVEGRNLAGSHGGGVAEQDDGAVADTDRGAGVDPLQDLRDLRDGERVGLAAWRDAHNAAESATDASYDEVSRRVGQALLMVSMSDAGAVSIECPERQPGLVAIGEERGQGLG